MEHYIKDNIKKLIKAEPVVSKVSKETGISYSTVSDIFKGFADLGRVGLDNAIKLNDYYIKLKGEIKMKKIYETINHNFLADGQEDKYVTIYNSLDEIEEQFGDIEHFMEKFGEVAIKENYFPIITLDDSSSTYAEVFTKLDSREDIISEAYDFFDLDNSVDGIWYFEDYTVYEESEMLKFEDLNEELLGYVRNDNADLQEDLNKGADPIEDGWEDGNGNTVDIEGWSQE